MNDAEFQRALLPLVIGGEPGGLPSDAEWPSWQMRARFQRVVPLLYQLVDQHDTELSHDIREQVRQLQADAMAWAVRVEHAVLDTAKLLDGQELRWAVLKGVATAHLDYVDPAWRQFGDADLLVDPVDFASVCDLLVEAGWHQGYELPRYHEAFTHAITFLRDDIELDLHQRLGHRGIGRLVPTDELLDRRSTFEIASTELPALDDNDRLIHAALHAVTSRGTTKRLSSVADVLLLAQGQAGSSGAVLERSNRWGVGSLVVHAVLQAYGMAEVQPPSEWNRAAPARGAGLVDTVYLSDRRRPILEELLHLRLLDGWRERGRYVFGHLRPGPRHTATFGDVRRSQVRYLWSKLRHGG